MAQTQASERADARRVVGLFDKTMTGPVASLWVSSLNTHRPVRLSDGGTAQGGPQRTRFTITRTEDTASYSLIPCAAEEWFRPLFEQNSKFGNPAKLKFRYSAH